jgi:hypothetical protein
MAKLTLNIEPGLISQIKTVAKKRNISISKMTEKFFKGEVETEKVPFRMKTEDELSDWVKGLVAVDKPTPDFDNKAEYREHILQKYK